MIRGETTVIPSPVPHPRIVPEGQWLAERKKLLVHEKELTKHHDRVNAERRRLPMVKIEKDYVFDGPNGKQSLKDLFDGRRQLIVYHFMFDPAWDKRLPRLHELCRRPRRSVDAERTRHDVRGRFSRPAGQARGLQSAKGMEHRRGFPRLAAISTTIFTSRWTRKSRPSNTTIGTRLRWRQRRATPSNGG